MQEFPEEAPETFDSLSTDELLHHKNWKAKKIGYDRLTQAISDGSFTDSHMIPTFLKEPQTLVFEAVIELVHTFSGKYPDKLSSIEILNPICERGLAGRPRVLNKSIEILSLIAGNGSSQIILDTLIKLSAKSPKTKACMVEMITSLIKAHGVKAECREISSFAFSAMNDNDGKVRKAALFLVVELHKHFPSVIEPKIDGLREVQKAEIGKLLNLVQKNETPKKADNVKLDGGQTQATAVCEIKHCSEPMEVLGNLSNSFYSTVSDTCKKFPERMAMLQDDLIPLITFSDLKHGDYSELIRTFRCLLTDPQIPLQVIAVRCIGYVSNGLKEKFNSYYKLVIHQLVDKLKEKKTFYLDALRYTLHSINIYSCGINDIYSEIEASLFSRVPHQRFNTLIWLTEVVRRDRSERNTHALKTRGDSLLKKLQHDDKKDVRDAANALVEVLHSPRDGNTTNNDTEVFSSNVHNIVSPTNLSSKSPSMKKQRISLHGKSASNQIHSNNVNIQTPKKGEVNVELYRVSLSERVSMRNKVTADDTLASTHQDVFTRIKSAHFLTNLRESNDWKVRLQALRTIRKMVLAAGTTATAVDALPVLLALKTRFEDKNKNIVSEALGVIEDMLKALGQRTQKVTKFIAPAVVQFLKDQKSSTRENAKAILEICVDAGGFDALSPCLPWSLLTDSSMITHVMVHLIEKSFQATPHPQPRALLTCIPGILKASLNRSHELRMSVDKLLPDLITNVGYAAVERAASDFRETDQRTLHVTLQGYKSKIPTRKSTDANSYELPMEVDRLQTTPVFAPSSPSRKIEEPADSSLQYSTPLCKSQSAEEPIGRLSAKFEHSVVVSRNDGLVKSARRLTPAKINLGTSPAPSMLKGKNAPASHSFRESCQLIKCGTIEQALYQCYEWTKAFQTSSSMVILLDNHGCITLIESLLSRLNSLMENLAFHGIDTGFRLIETVEELLKRPEYVVHFDEQQIREIFSALVERILDLRLLKYPNLSKQLNVLGFYLIQNSGIETCISSLMQELTLATDSYFHSISNYNTRMLDFTCKCLQKVSQRFSQDRECSIGRILRVLDDYFQHFPPYLFHGKNNTPVTTIRQIITELVNQKGKIVLSECVSMNMEDTLVYQFIEMSVKNNELNRFMDRMQATPPKPLGHSFGRTRLDTIFENKESGSKIFENDGSLPSSDVIDRVFASIKRLNQTEEGIKELFKLLKEFPQIDVITNMKALNTSHRVYVARRLHRLLQADIASGVLPEGYILNVPTPENL